MTITSSPNPKTFPADDFEPGDHFALEIRPNDVYEILDRTDRPNDMLEFQVQRSNEPGAEPIEYCFTFPAQQPVSARRRLRKYTRKCMLCPREHTVTVDTAYSLLEAVVCGNH